MSDGDEGHRGDSPRRPRWHSPRYEREWQPRPRPTSPLRRESSPERRHHVDTRQSRPSRFTLQRATSLQRAKDEARSGYLARQERKLRELRDLQDRPQHDVRKRRRSEEYHEGRSPKYSERYEDGPWRQPTYQELYPPEELYLPRAPPRRDDYMVSQYTTLPWPTTAAPVAVPAPLQPIAGCPLEAVYQPAAASDASGRAAPLPVAAADLPDDAGSLPRN